MKINDQALSKKIILRLMEKLSLNNEKELAQYLNISAENFSNKKRRGSLIAELMQLAFSRGIPINDLFNKPGYISNPQTMVVQENEGPLYNKDMIPQDQKTWKISDAVNMATRVLDSGTSFADALYVNIVHFDRALNAEGRIVKMEHHQDIQDNELQLVRKELDQLKTVVKVLQDENDSLKMMRSSGVNQDLTAQKKRNRAKSSRKTL